MHIYCTLTVMDIVFAGKACINLLEVNVAEEVKKEVNWHVIDN